MKKLLALSLVAVMGLGGMAYAQTHDTHGAKKAASANDSAATKAYRTANNKMHEGMNLKFSNDADVDFIRGMIPHHQGAIDMAKVVLQYGKDAQTRKWAEDIIREQAREIAEMQDWLAKNKKVQ
jgi:uncharacterized protein (DUF305 family)